MQYVWSTNIFVGSWLHGIIDGHWQYWRTETHPSNLVLTSMPCRWMVPMMNVGKWGANYTSLCSWAGAVWVPARLLKGRICKEIKTNLVCIREETERVQRNRVVQFSWSNSHVVIWSIIVETSKLMKTLRISITVLFFFLGTTPIIFSFFLEQLPLFSLSLSLLPFCSFQCHAFSVITRDICWRFSYNSILDYSVELIS